MPRRASWIRPDHRARLLERGIVIVDDGGAPGRRHVRVSGHGAGVEEAARARLGDDIDVEVVGELPRRLEARRCVGYMEREPGRLQLRYVLKGNEHMDDIVVAEADEAVVVFATVCTSAGGERGASCEGPWHVYLERPLGNRTVVDGASGRRVPFKNVYVGLDRRL